MACPSAAAGARCATAAWRLGSIGLSRCETAVRGACLIASQPSILASILYHGTVGQLTATCHGKQESVEQLEEIGNVGRVGPGSSSGIVGPSRSAMLVPATQERLSR